MPTLGISDDDTDHQHSAREIAKLIRKLRWIGENDQAEKLQNNLRLVWTEECILTVPSETD